MFKSSLVKQFFVVLSLIFVCSGLALAQTEQATPLQFVEATFEANGSPLYVLNARARVKNVSAKGHRGATVHFYCRLNSGQEWTLVGERPLPGILPGHSATCDLVGSTEGLPIVDSEGDILHCQYRMEIRYKGEVTVKEGDFHPSCIHEDHDGDEHGHGHD